MAQAHIDTVPHQSAEVYRVLEGSKGMTAKQVAKELKVLPNTVYRAVKPLLEFGMIEELGGYPANYKALPPNSAMNWYLRAAAQSFRHDFGVQAGKKDDSAPSITFIKNREHLLKLGEQDARNAKKSINYIVSGHRVPDSTVLAYRKAAAVGVRIRAITQNTPDAIGRGGAQLEDYQDMGAEVRHFPNIGIRLFVFDGKTAYLTSYDTDQSSRAFGIRFTHGPVAAQLDELFEQRWRQAKPFNQ